MKKKLVRRSLLYTPGSSQRMIKKAWETNADSIIFDLEDSVDISEKEKARENVVNALLENRDTKKEVIVRINSMDSIYGIHDILTVAKHKPDAILIPKANKKSIATADTILLAIEEANGLERESIKIIVLLETPDGITNAYSILKSSSRINGVLLGAEDLTNELGIKRTLEGDEIFVARNLIAYAAHACKIDVIDTPFTSIHDYEGLKFDTEIAKGIGFTGKSCIHPYHIDIINEVFTPSEEEVDFSKKLLNAYEEALKLGKGACKFEGKMIDRPIAERAKKIVEKANYLKFH